MAIGSVCKREGFLQVKVNDKNVWMGRDVWAGIAVESALTQVKEMFGLDYEIKFFDSNGNLLK